MEVYRGEITCPRSQWWNWASIPGLIPELMLLTALLWPPLTVTQQLCVLCPRSHNVWGYGKWTAAFHSKVLGLPDCLKCFSIVPLGLVHMSVSRPQGRGGPGALHFGDWPRWLWQPFCRREGRFDSPHERSSEPAQRVSPISWDPPCLSSCSLYL